MTQLYRSLSAVANPHRCLDSPNAATGQGAWLKSLDMSQKKKKKKNINTKATRQMPTPNNPNVALLYFYPLPRGQDFMDLYENSRQKGGIPWEEKRGGKKKAPLKLPQLKDMRLLQRQSQSQSQTKGTTRTVSFFLESTERRYTASSPPPGTARHG